MEAFRYFVEVYSPQHMLFANEIADIVYNLGWSSDKGAPPINFVREFMNSLLTKNSRAKMYYETSKGLKRVYEPSDVDILLSTLTSNEVKNLNKYSFTVGTANGKTKHFYIYKKKGIDCKNRGA
jgi:hypothetical protein